MKEKEYIILYNIILFMVCNLTKSIYGLKQTSHQWYRKFYQVIISFGFEMNVVDDCVYRKFSWRMFNLVSIYAQKKFGNSGHGAV